MPGDKEGAGGDPEKRVHGLPPQPPEGLNAGNVEEEALPSVKESFLGRWFGDQPFTFTEKEDQAETVDRDDDGSISFRAKDLDVTEAAIIQEFLDALSRPEGIKGTRFEWFFEEESSEFLEALKKALEAKSTSGGSPDSLANLDVELRSRIEEAAKFFREAAKRQEIKKALEGQVPRLPFEKIIVKNKKTGEETELTFEPVSVLAGTSRFDYVYVNNGGSPELLISIKDSNFEIVGISGSKDDDELIEERKFVFQSVKKLVDTSPYDGKDSTCFELEIGKGGSAVNPLFKKVRVFTEPMDLGKEIDDFVREQEEKKRLEEEKERRRAQQAYSSQPPAASSTPPQVSPPRYSAPPPSYVRSG